MQDVPHFARTADRSWQACHGGQRRTAELLLARGADINGHPDYNNQFLWTSPAQSAPDETPS
ncbi:MAG: hypothetical protein ACRDRL_32195 [Sciscionella sp.]